MLDTGRGVFYLFRLGTVPATLLARFTDEREARRTAAELEAIGWRVSVLSRLEERTARRGGVWTHVYRSPRRSARQRRRRYGSGATAA